MNTPESAFELPVKTPQERLAVIQDFLFTTNDIRSQRVYYATVLSSLVDHETLEATQESILEDTDKNIGQANEALAELSRETRRALFVQNPRTGEFGKLRLVCATREKLTFLGQVSLGGANQTWDIGPFPSFSLE